MSWISRRLLAGVLALGCVFFQAASAQEFAPEPVRAGDAGPEVWLVTYGPGEIYWQRFGHNGLWVRDPQLGLDHVFNFGFFDFAQPNFLGRFVQGRMLYFAAAQPSNTEFAQYIDENRSIRAQRLALEPGRALELADHLVRAVQPEYRDYLYDYYRDNCSTRIRDALDLGLGGAFRQHFQHQPAEQTYRDHTRRLTAADYGLYLGLEIVLGRPVDQAVTRWDEFFIPGELASAVSGFQLANGEPLVVEDVMLYSSNLEPPPPRPASVWLRYLPLGLVLLALGALLARWTGPKWLVRAWLLVAGLAGAAMTYFWLGTNHEVAAANLNLAIFNPAWLLGVSAPRLARPVAVLLLAGSGIALAGAAWPGGQYTADVLAAFLPVNLACAAWLWRAGRGPFRPPRAATA